MIRVKGRNGFFDYEFHVTGTYTDDAPRGYVGIYSNSPHTKSAPVKLEGPPREVINLLRQIARELESANRAHTAHNFHQERIKKHERNPIL